MSAVWHSKHVCCVTQQTCLLFCTADMYAVGPRTWSAGDLFSTNDKLPYIYIHIYMGCPWVFCNPISLSASMLSLLLAYHPLGRAQTLWAHTIQMWVGPMHLGFLGFGFALLPLPLHKQKRIYIYICIYTCIYILIYLQGLPGGPLRPAHEDP